MEAILYVNFVLNTAWHVYSWLQLADAIHYYKLIERACVNQIFLLQSFAVLHRDMLTFISKLSHARFVTSRD